jgi:hypothetical protein
VKVIPFTFFFLALFLAIPLVGYAQQTFHSGGVGNCDGCHTTHNSSAGQAMARKGNSTQFQGRPYLLLGSDPSSTCLKCHSGADTAPFGYHVMTYPTPADGLPPVQMTPGGDFAWLKKSYTWTTSEGESGGSQGERHGHNIVAADFGYDADTTLTTSPGGSYPSASLSCVSCHDPHGRYRITADGIQATTGKPIIGSGSYGAMPTDTEAVGVYRLLGGIGYQSRSVTGNLSFSYEAPFAVTPADYNRAESSSDVRVSYGKGVSLWCANCHPQAHPVSGGIGHPSDRPLGGGPALANYNAYVKTGDLTGNHSTAYTSLVPFQMETVTDLIVLKNATTSAAGPDSSDRVMCLTCHRTHASGWDSISRWNNSATLLVVDGDYPGSDTTGKRALGEHANGRTKAEVQATFYGRPASRYAYTQRSLCNKCHAKD